MSGDMHERAEALRDLVELRVPVEDAVAALAPFGWDSDTELVTFTRADALRLVSNYLDRTLSAQEAQRWAEALEGRDDLGLEPGFADILKQFLFEIATPELTEYLSPEVARRWGSTLHAAQPAADQGTM